MTSCSLILIPSDTCTPELQTFGCMQWSCLHNVQTFGPHPYLIQTHPLFHLSNVHSSNYCSSTLYSSTSHPSKIATSGLRIIQHTWPENQCSAPYRYTPDSRSLTIIFPTFHSIHTWLPDLHRMSLGWVIPSLWFVAYLFTFVYKTSPIS
jgi:hypothetical protein